MKYIIHICPRDKVWIVLKRAEKKHIYRAVAECFTRDAADKLYEELVKDFRIKRKS